MWGLKCDKLRSAIVESYLIRNQGKALQPSFAVPTCHHEDIGLVCGLELVWLPTLDCEHELVRFIPRALCISYTWCSLKRGRLVD
jgi:hypothetical protein